MTVQLNLQNITSRAWLLLHLVSDSMTRCEEEALAATSLSPQQFAVLMALKNLPEPVTQKSIADWLDRRANSVTVMLDRMVKDGLVTRNAAPRDRRAVCITMTQKGETAYLKGQEIASTFPPLMTTGLTDKDVRNLVRLLEKVRANTMFLRGLKKKLRAIESVMGEELGTVLTSVDPGSAGKSHS